MDHKCTNGGFDDVHALANCEKSDNGNIRESAENIGQGNTDGPYITAIKEESH